MASITEILQLCRLCLVKEQVNVPIFEEQGDIRQIFLKITACLPVKISREDKLPKKICSGCLYKLELLYQFWNTSTNAEKQLLSWLSAAGMDANTQTTQDAMAVVTQTQVVLKQEPETTENVTVVSDPDNFILQAATQPIEFPAVDFDYQENFSTAEQELANNSINTAADDSSESEPLAKRARRAATSTVTAPLIESEDDDADDPGEAVAAKTEEDSDDDTNMEPTFVDVAEDQDDEQPGPSGLGKIVEPPLNEVKTRDVFLKDVEDRKSRNLSKKIQKKHCNDIHGSEKNGLKSEFKCKNCSIVLPSKSLLRDHRNEMHPRGTQRELRAMYTVNKNLTEFTCSTCHEMLPTRKEVEDHVTIHLKRYPCPDCDQVFLRSKLYALHSRKHCKEGMMHCSDCDFKCKSYFSMAYHVDTIHLKLNSFECKLCKKDFKIKLLYDAHYKQHHKRSEFKCIVCEKIYHVKEYLLAHQRSMHFVSTGNAWVCCPICNKRFTSKVSLRRHMQSHNPEHLCSVCGQSFRIESELKIHNRMHTGETPYKCSYCEKSFRKRSNLRIHERVHTGEEPYSCENCGKSFKQYPALKVHLRIHTGERPYICIMCQKGFISNTALNYHKKSCSNRINQECS